MWFFRRTTYLWAVEWRVFVGGKYPGWNNMRSSWTGIDKASERYLKLKNSPPESHISYVRFIRRPVGGVDFL